MIPTTLSHFWQRRLYGVVLFFSVAIIILYALPIFTRTLVPDTFSINAVAVASAIVSAIVSGVFFFYKPKRPTFLFSYIAFLLFTITATSLVGTTGQLSSPYLAVWVVTALISGVFTIWGVLPILIISGVYVASVYLDGSLNPIVAIHIAIMSILPAGLSILLWRREVSIDESSLHVKSLTSQLSEVANRSEIIINAIGDGVVAIDSTGTIQLINPAGQEILGWGKQDVLKLNYRSVLQLLDDGNHELDKNDDPIAQVLNSNQTVRSNTLNIQTKSGKKISAAMVVSPIGENGNGVIAVFRDITKEKLEENEQAEFISTASHEMRTPVASIEGYLGLALNPATATIDEKARDFITKAHESAEHLGRLFQDLLDVSKSEDGRMTSTPRVVDITDLAGKVVESLQTKAEEKQLKLVFNPTSQRSLRTFTPLYFVNQDIDHIREILDNLVENAIKYTPQGEIIVDITSEAEDKVTISVTDSGLGIPAEDLPHLFQKFYRINNLDRQSIGGTGLGLYLSRRLAEAMQGRLWVESVYEKGSTFYLELPRITNEESERLKAQQQKAPIPEPVILTPPAPEPTQVITPPVVTPPQPTASANTVTQPAPVTPATTPPKVVTQPVAASKPAIPTPSAPAATPTPNVPRGQNLTREQIAERVRELEALARTTRPNDRPVEKRNTEQP